MILTVELTLLREPAARVSPTGCGVAHDAVECGSVDLMPRLSPPVEYAGVMANIDGGGDLIGPAFPCHMQTSSHAMYYHMAPL